MAGLVLSLGLGVALAAGSQFGISMDLEGDIAVIGDDAPGDGGGVYVFDLSDDSETEAFLLDAGPGATAVDFGIDVALDDGLLAVGSDVINTPDGNRVAALFDLSTTPPTRLPPVGPTTTSSNTPVAVDDGVAVVFANEALGPSNSSVAILDTALDPGDPGFERRIAPQTQVAGEAFGLSLAIDDGVILAGAPSGTIVPAAGAAYLFDAITGAELAAIDAPDAANEGEFGVRVALSGNLALIGAREREPAPGEVFGPGVVYLYDLSSLTTPVPLPPSALLLIAATGALALVRRWASA